MTAKTVLMDDAEQPMDTFLQTVIYGAGIGALDGMLALGIVLIYRTTGVLNFAQAATGTFAAYVTYSIAQSWPLPLALTGAAVAGAGLGVATQGAVGGIRTKHHALTSAVATLAAGILIDQAIHIGWGSSAYAFPSPFGGGGLTIGKVYIPFFILVALVTGAGLAAGTGSFLRWTRPGTMLRALADNPDAARLCGANVTLLVAGAWAWSGVLATVAAFFAAQIVGLVPGILGTFFLGALIAAVLGGLGSLSGAFCGALALEVARNLFVTYRPDLTGYTQTFLLLLLIAVLVLAPRRWLAQGPRRLV